MRLFLAVDLPQELREQLGTIGDARGVKAVDPRNMHITLKFLGDTDEEGLAFVKQRMRALSFKTFELSTTTYGSFGTPPRVFWLGVKASEELHEVWRQSEQLLVERFPRDARLFAPHITVARIKDPRPEARVFVDKHRGKVLDYSWTVSEIVLYRSTLKPDGPVYEKIAQFRTE